jgi:AraC-like DNA-binding protein
MLHRSHVPAAPLRDFVEDFWLYEDYQPARRRDRIVPSGTMELVINLREDELRLYHPSEPDRCTAFPGALVSGAFGAPFAIDTLHETAMIGVHFRPGGAFPFLGLPAGDLADAHVSLEALWGRRAGELRERLCGAVTPAARFRLLEEALLHQLRDAQQRHPAVAAALQAFCAAPVQPSVRDLARDAGLSRRRFIELFNREVGLTPKLFSRIRRFQHALLLARRKPAPEWAQLALDAGYCDQSHLIRDFIAFAGISPAQFAAERKRLDRQGAHVKRNHLPLPS